MSEPHDFERIQPVLASIAKAMARQFGPNCEVVVHNTTRGVENTIAIIENGQVSGRKVGGEATEIVVEAMRNKDIQDKFAYVLKAPNGKMLKCSSVNVRNPDGEVIAVFCINYDISDLVLVSRTINDLCLAEQEAGSINSMSDNISDLLDQMIEEARQISGKPVSAMTKDDKVEAVQYLDSKGALLIKKSSERIAEYFGMSKFTLYNYLGEKPCH
ncbi:MAG: helix-turn-helix transcriptional regulator [Actinomycetia bacterium]|nr:helix-turn-helix transcriptional regulator [Actinomycetes bacterium]